MTKAEKKVLDRDAFDALELSSLVYGGIGADTLYENHYVSLAEVVPFCVLGHAGAATNQGPYENPITEALIPLFEASSVGFSNKAWGPANANNRAVRVINERKGKPETSRVSWKEYTRELNIVRGD